MIKLLNLPAQLKQLIQNTLQTNRTKLENVLVHLLKLSKEVYPYPYVANNKIKQSTLLSTNISKAYYDLYTQYMSDKTIETLDVSELIREYKLSKRLGYIFDAINKTQIVDLILATYDTYKKVFIPLKRFNETDIESIKPIVILDILAKSLVIGNSPSFIATSNVESGEYIIDSYPHHLIHTILEMLHSSDLQVNQLKSIQPGIMYSPRLIGLILLANKLTDKYNTDYFKIDNDTHKNIVRSYMTIGYTTPNVNLLIPVILNWHLVLSALEVAYITVNLFANRRLDKTIYTYYLLLRPVIQVLLEHIDKEHIYELTHEYESYWQLYYDADIRYKITYKDALDIMHKINNIVNRPQKSLTDVLQEYASKQKFKLSTVFTTDNIQYLENQFRQINNFVSLLFDEQHNNNNRYLTIQSAFELGILSYDITKEEDVLMANFTLPINLSNVIQRTKAEVILRQAIDLVDNKTSDFNFDPEYVFALNTKIQAIQETLYAFTENNITYIPVYTIDKLRKLLKLYAKYNKADNIDLLFLRHAQLTQEEQSLFKHNLVTNFLKTGLIDVNALSPKTIVLLTYILLFNLTEQEFKTLVNVLTENTTQKLYDRAIDFITKLSAYLMLTNKRKTMLYKLLKGQKENAYDIILARNML